MAATDARAIPWKNAAYRVTFPIFDADGDLVTGAAGLDSEVSIDGGTFADVTAEATEIATSSGMYYLDLTSGEMNGDTIAIIVKTSTSGAKTTPIVLYPEEAGDVRVNVTQVSGDATAADNAEAFFDGTGYAGTNNVIPVVTTVNGLAANVVTAAAIADAAIDAATFAAGAINAAAIAADAIGASELAADAVAEIADQVWDELLSGHAGAGSAGAALSAAGSAGDPWITALPGAYGAGTAGKIVGDNVNAPIATVDTVVDAIKAKTDNLPADPADDSDIDAQLATIAGYLDTEVAAIKAKTDTLPASPAAVGSQMDLVNAPNATAVTAIQNGLATAANLATVDTVVDAILADTGTDGVALATAVKQAIADEVLKRGVSNVEATADATSLAGLVLAAFESAISGTTWTINKTTGAVFTTKAVTLDAAAVPIIAVT